MDSFAPGSGGREVRRGLFGPPRDFPAAALGMSIASAASFASKSPLVWGLNVLFALLASGGAFEKASLAPCFSGEKANFALKMPALNFKKASEKGKAAPIGLPLLLFPLSFASILTPFWYIVLPAPLLSAAFLMVLLRGSRKGWREKVKWQKQISSWFAESGWNFAVEDAAQVDEITILRLRPESMEKAFRLSSPLLKERLPKTWQEALILPLRRGERSIDPHSFRLVLSSKTKALKEAKSEGKASLLAGIAYGLSAQAWGKKPPLVTARNIGLKEPAWLFQITAAPGGASVEEMGKDWLQDPSGPAAALQTPVLADLASAFHLAPCGRPLSDKGNAYRDPDFMKEIRSFDRYVREGLKWASFKRKWASVSKLPCPDPIFSDISCEGGIDLLPLRLDPSKIFDYAKVDLSALGGKGAVMAGSDGTECFLVQAEKPAIGDLKEGGTCQRAWAAACALKALVSALPARKGCEVDFCSFEGKRGESSIWRVGIRLQGGATVADLRKKEAALRASAGSEILLLEYLDPARCALWLMSRGCFAKGLWKREKMRSEAMDLFLASGWLEAGAFNRSGEGPELQKREDAGISGAFTASFSLPVGLSLQDLKEDLPVFLRYSGFKYGRILPSSSGENADVFISPENPLPKFAKTDFKKGKGLALGVGDRGQEILWDLSASPHLLVMGRSGAGKSSLASLLAAKAALEGWKVIVIDPCKGAPDFSWVRKKGSFCGAGEFEKAERLVRGICSIMRERAEDLSSRGLASSEEAGMENILLVFDEFNGYIASIEAKEKGDASDIALARQNAAVERRNRSISSTAAMLGSIATQGRSAGIRLLIGAQRLGLKDMEKFRGGRAFYRSLGKVVLGSDSPAGVFQTSNLKEANRLLRSLDMPKGRGLYEDGQGRLEALQSYWAPKEEIEEMLSALPDAEPFVPEFDEADGAKEPERLNLDDSEGEEEEEVVDFGII